MATSLKNSRVPQPGAAPLHYWPTTVCPATTAVCIPSSPHPHALPHHIPCTPSPLTYDRCEAIKLCGWLQGTSLCCCGRSCGSMPTAAAAGSGWKGPPCCTGGATCPTAAAGGGGWLGTGCCCRCIGGHSPVCGGVLLQHMGSPPTPHRSGTQEQVRHLSPVARRTKRCHATGRGWTAPAAHVTAAAGPGPWIRYSLACPAPQLSPGDVRCL